MSRHVASLPPDGRQRSSTLGCKRHGVDYEKFLDGRPWLVSEDDMPKGHLRFVGSLRARAAHRSLRVVGRTDAKGRFYVQAVPIAAASMEGSR
jgi:hypothetical protein